MCVLPSGVAGAGSHEVHVLLWPHRLSAENQVLAKYLGGWKFPAEPRNFRRLYFGLPASYSGGMRPGASGERHISLQSHWTDMMLYYAADLPHLTGAAFFFFYFIKTALSVFGWIKIYEPAQYLQYKFTSVQPDAHNSGHADFYFSQLAQALCYVYLNSLSHF